jgi:hypothetical protein
VVLVVVAVAMVEVLVVAVAGGVVVLKHGPRGHRAGQAWGCPAAMVSMDRVVTQPRVPLHRLPCPPIQAAAVVFFQKDGAVEWVTAWKSASWSGRVSGLLQLGRIE